MYRGEEMSETIETSAIYYHKSTDNRNCYNCVYKEVSVPRGLICIRWDLPTRRDMICGEHIPESLSKPKEKHIEQENTLF